MKLYKLFAGLEIFFYLLVLFWSVLFFSSLGRANTLTTAQLDALKTIDSEYSTARGSYVDICENVSSNASNEVVQACDIILNTEGW